MAARPGLVPLGAALVALGAVGPAVLPRALPAWVALLDRIRDPRPEALEGALRAALAWGAATTLGLLVPALGAALGASMAVSAALRRQDPEATQGAAGYDDLGPGLRAVLGAVALGVAGTVAMGAVAAGAGPGGLGAVGAVLLRGGGVALGLGVVEVGLRVALGRQAEAAAAGDRATARRRQREETGAPEVRAEVRARMGAGSGGQELGGDGPQAQA